MDSHATFLNPGASAGAAELQALCEQNLARFKIPVRWDFVAQMPRTPLGKIQKYLLQRDLLERQQVPDRRHPPANYRPGMYL